MPEYRRCVVASSNWCPPGWAREIKLGTGGLRDVEFAVQLLQLVHGRNDESLHVASTVDALAALGAGGYVGRDDAANMTASYEFLRLLEHRLQLQRLKRTHMLPGDRRRRGDAMAGRGAPAARRPARRAGCAARRAQAAKPAGVEAARQALLSAAAGVGWSTGAWPFGGYDPEAAERQLAALGYEGPQSALTHLAALTSHSGRRGRVQQVLLPTLLDWLSDTPDPDAGLLAYRRISEELSDSAGICRRCATRARWPNG